MYDKYRIAKKHKKVKKIAYDFIVIIIILFTPTE